MEELRNNAERVMGFSVLLSSPKKLGEILFQVNSQLFSFSEFSQKLKLQPTLSQKSKGMSTKSGNQSTSEAVLATLTKQHPLPGIILGTLPINNNISQRYQNIVTVKNF
jgi:DNA polymerase I-like protein with 3'-5' exonuclease and polymerase domains